MSQTTISPRTLLEDRPRPRVRPRRNLLRPVLMLGGIAAVIIGAGAFWLNGGRYVSIDDAYIRAPKLSVATDVSGIVQDVAVHEGQHVKAGDVLLRLNSRQFDIALRGARANLALVALNLQAMKRDYVRMLRDADAKQSQVDADQASYDRFAYLVRGSSVSRAEYDDARFKLAADKSTLESLKTQASVQLAKLAGNPDADISGMPDFLQAQARVEEAQRQLDHSVIKAPFAGIATQVDQVQPGMYLAASTAAFGLVASDRFWIEGNPKETELTNVKVGDHVDVAVDSYPGRVWTGTVQSVAPVSGSEFSILPAQNSSGNWVKVVQRIPVRIQVERHEGDPPLSSGMSVVADIDTGHVRHLSDLIP
jgi:membrane fusion protein (multidrug efflux system)